MVISKLFIVRRPGPVAYSTTVTYRDKKNIEVCNHPRDLRA